MLSGLLRSEVAVQANINIMRAFFQMQEALLIVSNTQLQLEQIRAEIKQLRTDMNDTLADQNWHTCLVRLPPLNGKSRGYQQ